MNRYTFAVFLSTLLSAGTAAGAPPLEEPSAWTLSHVPADRSPFTFTADGLEFVSRGIAKLERNIVPLEGPMEAVVDLDLSRGSSDRWRNNGIVVTFSSAPVDAMEAGDWAVVFQVLQQGVTATALQGGAGWGVPRPNDARNIYSHQGNDIAPRFQLTMNGAGGERYSAQWPAGDLADTRLRFHVHRDDDHVLHFSIFHGDAPEGPWWEAGAALPVALRDRPLRFATVYVSQEARRFEDPETTNRLEDGKDGTGTGNAVFAGRIIRMEIAASERPQWNRPLPAPPLNAKPRPDDAASVWLPEGGLEALREKFNHPDFTDYRTVLLRNADPDPQVSLQRRVGTRLTAATWAYLLTGDETYLARVRGHIDTACRVTDDLPAEKFGSPGRLRQDLDTREFQIHRYEALAQTYDLLYSELNAERREAIHRALLRALDQYRDRIDSGSWWYLNNPSNTIGVGNGGAGLIALALRHRHPDLARDILDTAVPTILKQYVGVADDGGCNEGNMYWNYGMSYPLMLGYALRHATGDDRGLLRNERVRNAHRYVETNLGGDGRMVPFNDTQPWLNGWMICAAAGAEFDQPLMRWMADHMARDFTNGGDVYEEQVRSTFAVMAFLFRDRVAAPKAFPGVPAVSHLDSTQEGILRSAGDVFKPALVTAIKGNGEQNTHHANQDQGSFTLYADGEMLLLDPGYFENTADKHSLPLVGDPETAKLNARAFAPISNVFEDGNLRSLTVDATSAYNTARDSTHQVKRARRVFVQIGDLALIVLNDFELLQDDVAIHDQFQAGAPAEIHDGQVRITGLKTEIAIQTFGPDGTWEATPRAFNKDWVYADRETSWTTLRNSYIPTPELPRISVLSRVPSGNQAPSVEVIHGDGTVDIHYSDAPAFRFVMTPEGWKIQRF